MITRVIPSLLLLAAAVPAADLPAIPAEPLGGRKELLFQDDFESATPAVSWHRAVDTFTLEGGTLKGTQTREKDQPSMTVWHAAPRARYNRAASASRQTVAIPAGAGPYPSHGPP